MAPKKILFPLSLLLARLAKKDGPRVLMYHSVDATSKTPAWKWAVSLELFRAQLDLLAAAGWQTCCIRDIGADGLTPPKSVALTFDDGYADNAAAFAELHKRGMRATWFIVSNDVGKHSGWVDPGVPSRALLTLPQISEFHAAGMEIGAHGRTHRRLAQLESGTLAEEVHGSRTDLQDMLGHEIVSFSYPYGEVDDRVMRIVRAAGFTHACTVRPGLVASGKNLLLLPRLAVCAEDDLATFARKLVLAENKITRGKVLRFLWRAWRK